MNNLAASWGNRPTEIEKRNGRENEAHLTKALCLRAGTLRF
jgi:hypothetical protein